MHELERILEASRRALAAHRPSVLATVVQVEGSAYRRPGARMWFGPDAAPVGMISGGCLEADLLERMEAVLKQGSPTVVSYDLRSHEESAWAMGLGCGGSVRVLLEPLKGQVEPAYFEFLTRRLTQREPGALVTVIARGAHSELVVGDRLAYEGSGLLDEYPPRGFRLRRNFEAAAREALRERRSAVHAGVAEPDLVALVEYHPLVPQLFVFGAGADVEPVVGMARELGWRVFVVHHPGEGIRSERFNAAGAQSIELDASKRLEAPRVDAASAAVVMTHRFNRDLELLRWLVATDVAYLAILGPQRRSARLIGSLESERGPLGPSARARIHAPAGLDLGAESPAEIALAILAEAQAVLAGRSGRPLRERTGPLHEPACRELDPR